jgi:zinc finger BED domain-containing protein 1 (E3 SUMO-protein ligase ZBED1)
MSDDEDEDFTLDSPKLSSSRESKKRKRFSSIWQHFNFVLGEKCVCKLCGKNFKSTTSTTSLRYHIEKAHPDEVSSPVVLNEMDIVFETDKAEELLTKFIVSNYLSFRLVDSESFRALIRYLQPKWKVCDRKKFSETLVPALRREIETKMKERMTTIHDFSISLDGWTSAANTAYLAVTAHGISKSFAFESFLLDIASMKKDETGTNIAELVKEILEAWEIDLSQIVAGTSDGGSNVKKAIKRDLDLLWIYCLAHALNRSIRVGLDKEPSRSLIKKTKRISKFFRNSPKASKVLLEQQKHLKMSTKKMTIDNKTRWGSAYKMLERLLGSRPAISASLAIATGTRKKPPPDLSSDEWEELGQLKEALEPLHEATKFLSAEKYPILSSVTPLFRRIFDLHLEAKDSDGLIAVSLKETIRTDLLKKWGSLFRLI